jgi:uncharacterized membrane protein YraQ (UPF0718 family)
MPVSEIFLDFTAAFLELLLDVAPFYLVGVITGALVQTYATERLGARLLGGRGAGAIGRAVAAGAILPGCSCTTVPMARGLQGTGAVGLGTIAAFILVSPLLSPTTVVLTWGVLGWQMTLARIVASVLGALALGLIIARFETWFEATEPTSAQEAEGCCHDGSCDPAPPTLRTALREILRETAPYLLLGLGIASLLTTLLPSDAIPRFLGGASGVAAFALAAIVGIPLYTCEGEEVPVTLGLMSVGLGAGPALTFLLGSVGTCIPTALMARGVIGDRALVVYLLWWFVLAIGAGVTYGAMVG